ncbi:MAG: SGNH/GDSL hydrolase family protein [Phycisphaerae bacterium]
MAKKQPVLTPVQKSPVAEPDYAKVSFTRVDEVFAKAARARPTALRVLAEGDSWFAYPRGGLLVGAPSNVVQQLQRIDRNPQLLIHDLSSNGDEAVAMVAGASKLELLKRLSSREYDVLLFSGGGNDIVGMYDFDFFLNDYRQGFSAVDCLRLDRFERRLGQIMAAYQDLIDLTGDYAANKAIKIVSHTYDLAVPDPRGAQFLGGLLKIDGARSWMYPYLMDHGITDPNLQKQVAAYMLGRFRDMMLALANAPESQGRFVVVDTHGTLKPADWLNEIHPTPDGFLKIARRIYTQALVPLARTPGALPRLAAARKATASRPVARKA